jgi:hypothetical protein
MRRIAIVLGVAALLMACGGGDDDAPSDGEAAAGEQSTTTEPPDDTTTTTAPPAPRIVYEITGTGTVVVDYAIAGDRSQSAEVTLPWSEEQAEDPSRMSMLVALTGSEGDVTCRIRRGDEVLAEASLSLDLGPLLSCDYPPSGLPPVTYPPGFDEGA